MPLRHSRPAHFFSMARRTTASHGSPAAAVSSTSSSALPRADSTESDAQNEPVDPLVRHDQVRAAAEHAERKLALLRPCDRRQHRRLVPRLEIPACRASQAHRGEGRERHPFPGQDPRPPGSLDAVSSLGGQVDVLEVQARQRGGEGADPVAERSSCVQENELSPLDQAAAAAPHRRGLERLDPHLDAQARRDAHQLVEQLPVVHAGPLPAPRSVRRLFYSTFVRKPADSGVSRARRSPRRRPPPMPDAESGSPACRRSRRPSRPVMYPARSEARKHTRFATSRASPHRRNVSVSRSRRWRSTGARGSG